MDIPLYIVNAFSHQHFGGNPAAVCPLGAWLPDELMQKIAAQHNLSETAFFVPAGRDGFHIRWFTPTCEVALCGHATLASAFVLLSQLGHSAPIHFDSLSGPLEVTGNPERLTLDFPLQPLSHQGVSPALITALGATPQAALAGEDLVAVFASQKEVEQLAPDFARLKHLPYRGIIVTAPGDDADFVCRFFAPAAGIDEDPVTGSAYTKLAPYWREQLGRNPLNARQLSARGGEIECEVKGERVLISGSAKLYASGRISLS
jgi:PhzF family phenazine biosynthesis protein